MELATDHSQNLSDVNVARRLRVGIVFLTTALLLAALFQLYDAPVVYRLALFPVFFLAENAFFQAIYKTCGFSAFFGVRHTPEGNERIACRDARRDVKHRGIVQIGASLCTAALLTLLFAWVGS